MNIRSQRSRRKTARLMSRRAQFEKPLVRAAHAAVHGIHRHARRGDFTPRRTATVGQPAVAGVHASGWMDTETGFLTASYPLAQFIATPILGQLSDRFGRKKLLAVSLFGTSFGYVLFAIGVISRNIPLLFIARTFDGVTGGNIAVAQAAIADISTPENRTKNFGLMGATFGLGFILGPYIGGKLTWFGPDTPFWFAAILAGLNGLLVWTRMPETLKKFADKSAIRWTQSVTNIRNAFTIPGIRSVFPTVFLFNAGFAFFTSFFSLFLLQKLNFRENNIGDFFAYVGLWIAFTQAAISGALAKRFPDWKVIRVALPGLTIGLLAALLPSNTTQLLLVAPLIPLFVGTTMANITSLVSRTAPPDRQGELLGINASVAALAQAIPAILTGFLAGIAKEVPVLTAAGVVFVAAVLFWVMYRPADSATAARPQPAAD